MYFLAATIFFLVARHVSGFRLDALLHQDDEGTLYVAFLFIAAIAIGAVNQSLGLPGPFVLFAITYGILTPYVFLALKRVYAEPSGLTFAKTLGLLVIAFIIDSPINIAARLLTIAWT
jgi:hypothetical protein